MRNVAVTGNSGKKTAGVDEIATLIAGVDMICLAFAFLISGRMRFCGNTAVERRQHIPAPALRILLNRRDVPASVSTISVEGFFIGCPFPIYITIPSLSYFDVK